MSEPVEMCPACDGTSDPGEGKLAPVCQCNRRSQTGGMNMDNVMEVKLVEPVKGAIPEGRTEPIRALPETGRNEPCPCGSGRTYKHCHLRLFNEARGRKFAELRAKFKGTDREKARLGFVKKASAS